MKEWCQSCKTSVRSANRHASKCPVLLRRYELESKPYFCRDVNSYAAEISKEQTHVRVKVVDVQDALQIMEGVSHDSRLLRLEQLATCISFQTLVTDNVKLSEYQRQSRSENLPNKSRHELQYASIVTAMDCYGLIGDGKSGSGSSPVYVEFGAGRGYLSHFIAEMCPTADLVLIDHTSYRFKAERSLKGRLNCSVNRLTIDIKDVVLYKVPELQTRNVIGFGKHLCGSATDMALRACFEPCGIQRSLKVCGFAVATCCHHRCTWETYVNQPFLSDLGFGRNEFPHLTRVSSWATLDKSKCVSEVRGTHYKQEKIALGRLAKRILDSGRLQWCISKGFKAKMVTYIGEHISPENVLLLVKG